MNEKKHLGLKFTIIFRRKNTLHTANIPAFIISLYDMALHMLKLVYLAQHIF
jgi:hypothetical protein